MGKFLKKSPRPGPLRLLDERTTNCAIEADTGGHIVLQYQPTTTHLIISAINNLKP